MAELEEVATRVYTNPKSKIAHLIPAHTSPSEAFSPSVCEKAWSRHDGWRGTGTQDEIERAAALPLCSLCSQHDSITAYGVQA